MHKRISLDNAWRARLALRLCAAMLPWSCAHALEPDVIFERVSPSVWVVRALDAQDKPFSIGSGVVIGAGKIITNCHVLAKARSIQVRKEGTILAAKLEFPDPERDLCQLDVPELTAPPVILGDMQALKIGQRVYAIGNPQALELTMSEGIISSLRDVKDGSPLIQTTAPISRGSSGGGLFDNEGRLIGITTFSARDAQNLNFAHPVSWIRQVPERGAAVLAKRPAAISPLALQAPSPPQAPIAAETPVTFPRQLTGDELERHVRALRSVETNLSTLRRLEFRPNGRLRTQITSNIEPSGSMIFGRYTIDTVRNTVCISMPPAGLTSMATMVKSLHGCFTVMQLDTKSYTLKSTDDTFSVPYSYPR